MLYQYCIKVNATEDFPSYGKKSPVRNEANLNYTWAIEAMYASDDLWHADLEKARSFLQQVEAYKGKLGESAQALFSSLHLGDAREY